jgi:hypothetical protein
MKLYNFDGIDIPFDRSWKNIGIGLSGGADSALLAFLVCSLVNQNQVIHILSHTRMWKTRPWQSHDSLIVFNWLKDYFPNIRFNRHTNLIAPDIEYGNMGPTIEDEYGKMVSGDNAQQRAFAEYICFHHKVDAYYNAVTRNPRSIDLGGMKERDIEPTEDNKHLSIMKHMGAWALHPFRFIEKSWVVRQYMNYNLWDLFEKTRSCEGEFPNITYQNYVQGQVIPICNECFWCKERAWALEKSI